MPCLRNTRYARAMWQLALAFLVTASAGAATAAPVKLKVTYDADHLDLDAKRLEIKASMPPTSLALEVIGEDGSTIATAHQMIAKPPGRNEWIPITWTTTSTARVMMLKLRVAADGGIATNVELIPWSVAVEHEDVKFATDSAVITGAEGAKLDASLAKIAEAQKAAEKFMKLRLYIAGHTDTVGPTAKNRKLSLDRARAIATYFRTHGVTLPIAFAGFGEEVLKTKTADNTAEPTNRRADYILGPAAGAPPFNGAYLKVKANWGQLE